MKYTVDDGDTGVVDIRYNTLGYNGPLFPRIVQRLYKYHTYIYISLYMGTYIYMCNRDGRYICMLRICCVSILIRILTLGSYLNACV